MKTAPARANTKLGWTVADDAKKLKTNELKVLLGLLLLVVGVSYLVLGHLRNYPSNDAIFWILGGVLLLLNGFGVLGRRRHAEGAKN